MAMVGGIETLKQLDQDSYTKLAKQTEKLISVFKKWLHEYNGGQFSNYNIIHHSSLFWIVPGDKIKSVGNIPGNIGEDFVPLFELLLEKGIYLSPNAYEVGFMSHSHDDSVIEDLEKRLWS